MMVRRATQRKNFCMTIKQIHNFLFVHTKSGCAKERSPHYQAAILYFYESLPENNSVLPTVRKTTSPALRQWPWSTVCWTGCQRTRTTCWVAWLFGRTTSQTTEDTWWCRMPSTAMTLHARVMPRMCGGRNWLRIRSGAGICVASVWQCNRSNRKWV